MNPKTPLWQLTVGEFKDLLTEVIESNPFEVETNDNQYVYGMEGLANLLGCSKSSARRLKSAGVFEDALIQDGRKIIVDAQKALAALKK